MGVFPGTAVLEEQICAQYDVAVVGRLESVRERFYAITVERKLRHPAVVAVSEAARNALFAER
jgi:LysR family transcriptional regulator, transcriptional activator of nhaA